VANFSLHSSTPSSFTRDPLDRAVERLWLNGVVVVTSSGNYGSATGPSGVRYAPGNDPFVITVGALDLQKSFRAKDHVAAPWSAYGYTFDGFMKPEVVAPGRYLIGPVPANSTLALERPAQMVGADHIQLSGTSFSAAVVSGVAADLLALHPDWSPDQLKGALMLTARPDVNAAPLSTGVGEVDAASAAMAVTPPNPNLALEGFVNPNPDDGGLLSFDTVSWSEVAKSAVSWDQSAWDPASWNTAAWSLDYWADVSWDQVSYSDVSYDDVSYDDVSYDAVSYSDVSYEDAVLGDILTGGYPLQGAIGAP
jgi:serine protease AprX